MPGEAWMTNQRGAKNLKTAICAIVLPLAVSLAGCRQAAPPKAATVPASALSASPSEASSGSVSAPSAKAAAEPAKMSPERVTRLSPAEVHRKVKASEAMLVCAYPDSAKFARMKLQGAVARSAFEAKLASLARDQEIIFYCA